jgi:hypothetical protein
MEWRASRENPRDRRQNYWVLEVGLPAHAVGPVINMLFSGALLGLLLDFLVKKLKKPCIALMLTGAIFLVLFQLVLLLLLEAVYGRGLLTS